MNRMKVDLLQEGTTLPVKQLEPMLEPSPYSSGWLSERFPIYPITINMFIGNPPFNRISLSFHPQYLPSAFTLEGSADSKNYFLFHTTKFTPHMDMDPSNIIINLEQSHEYPYIRMTLHPPKQAEGKQREAMKATSNICKQVLIRAIQFTHVAFYGTEYCCSLKSALELDPTLFQLLELLEYKAILAKRLHDVHLSAKYSKKIVEVLKALKEKKENKKKLSSQSRQALSLDIEVVANEIIQGEEDAGNFFDKKAIKARVQELRKELKEYYIDRLGAIHKDVTDYFSKYWNVEVKEEYLRLLSSPDEGDHAKALSNFWSQAKTLEVYPPNIEEALVMYFNYFLEYICEPIKINAIKVLCLLFKSYPLSFEIYFVYERLLFNLYTQLYDPSHEELYNVSLKCIYLLFQKVPDNLFLASLLNEETSQKEGMKIIKLGILEKLAFRNVVIDDKDQVIQFLISVLQMRQLTLPQKNQAYNVIAYLAMLMGKQWAMSKFEKLNTMLTMNMEKIIDKKLQTFKNPGNKEEDTPGCEHCGVVRESFRDPNVYDLHCFKECKYLTSCRYCAQMVQIPELNKHYVFDCKQRNLFKSCEYCNESIVKDKEKQHLSTCCRQLATVCPLCGEKQVGGKLKLKEHILKVGCPNNYRS